MSPEEKNKIAREIASILPFSKALGMEVRRIESGVAEIAMPYDPRIVGDPETGVVHGGAVSALMDSCCGAAVVSHPDVFKPSATLDLRIDYMRSAAPEQTIVAHGECYHVTKTIAFVRARAVDDNADMPVATATGLFTVNE